MMKGGCGRVVGEVVIGRVVAGEVDVVLVVNCVELKSTHFICIKHMCLIFKKKKKR